MFRKITINFLLLVGAATSANADSTIKDPMQPPGAGYVASSQKAGKAAGWTVAEILISPERRLAVINGRVVKVGSVVNGARVSAIYGNVVELNINGKTVLASPGTSDIKRKSKQ